MFRILSGLGVLIFAMEHPYFVALSAVIYMFNQVINEEERSMLNTVTAKGSDWLKELNRLSRKKGMTMKQGRDFVSSLIDPIFSKLNKEDLAKINEDEFIQDKVIKFVQECVKVNEEAEEEWVAFPLAEADLLDEYEINFIKWCSPDFDWSAPYTHKVHRQLFKTMKSKFRNIDGTLNNEVANNAVLELEDWVYCFMTSQTSELYGKDENVTNYIIEGVFN